MEAIKPVWDYSDLLEEAKDRIEEKLYLEGEIKMIATNEIKLVIGSWGSYNECNERALGSKWLNLADYDSWEEIEEELRSEGFELDGMDEELFIQDIDNFPSDGERWDYIHPEWLFNLLKEADVLTNSYKYDVLMAFLEIRSLNEFKDLVERYGSSWDDDIILYRNYDWEDFGREMFENMGYQIPEDLLNYFDFKAYGESFQYDDIHEYSDGLIEILR